MSSPEPELIQQIVDRIGLLVEKGQARDISLPQLDQTTISPLTEACDLHLENYPTEKGIHITSVHNKEQLREVRILNLTYGQPPQLFVHIFDLKMDDQTRLEGFFNRLGDFIHGGGKEVTLIDLQAFKKVLDRIPE